MPMTRRQALQTLTATALATAAARLPAFAETNAPPASTPAPAPPAGPFTLPPLPYGYDALEPQIDALTMHLHHDKHHAGYVAKLNEALAKEPSFVPGKDVDDLIRNLGTVPDSIRPAVRNQGGGHANHSLFWQTLSPSGPRAPKGELAKAIDAEAGGFPRLKEEILKAGGALFGSGWVWLVLDGGKKLNILTMPNQDSPLFEGHEPIFGIDVWEHAYYLKYHNVRADYLKAIWDVLNWDFISARYAAAMKA